MRIRMVLKTTGKLFFVGFRHFADWEDMKVIMYGMDGHIVGCFSYGLEALCLNVFDAVNIDSFF